MRGIGQAYKLFLYSWRTLTSGSTNRKIFGAILTIGVLTALARVAYVGREFIVAWRFGTGDALDAFLIAFVVPSFVINVVSGSFNVALIPTYIRVRDQEGREAAQRLLSGSTVWSLGLLALSTLLIVAAAPLYLPWLAPGFDSEKLSLTFYLLCVISPVVLLRGVVVIWAAVLNAGERFALAAVTPIITPLVTVLVLLTASSFGIYALAAGLVCGAALEAVPLGLALRRRGVLLRPKWYGFDSHLRQVAGQYTPMIAGSFLMSGTWLVDQAMAAGLPSGSVSALNYANNVIMLPILLAATALGTAVLPYFSSMIANQDWAGARHTLRRYLSLVFGATVPVTIFFVLFSEPIIRILFERGSFTAQDTEVVARISAFYALQIPFYVSGILVVRLISSMRANSDLMRASALNLILNVILNYLFIRWLGVEGIALSTSLVYLVSTTYCWLMLNKRLPKRS